MTKQDKILREALLKHNLLSEKDLGALQKIADTEQVSLRLQLLRTKTLTEKQILIALSQHLNVDTVDFKNLTVEPQAIQKVPIKIATYYQILPIQFVKNVLIVASAEPLEVSTRDDLRVHLGMDINYVLAESAHLQEALKRHYGLASNTLDRIITRDPTQLDIRHHQDEQWVEDLEQTTEDPTVANLVNEIILEAYKKRATDIHIEPYRDKVRLRYRVDGVLVDANLPDQAKHFLPHILSRIKILANLSITEKRIPQDGSASVKTAEQQLDLRISTMPTPRGESIVIRILPTKVMLFSLEKLGFSQNDVKLFRQLIQKPHGIIFITGPTGSGKTTTLYACLNEINSSERKIITIEDPVEYEMQGITQVQVNPRLNFTFSTGLRSILRHDPDIIMVGEVRDPETAEIAIKTALTGHLVFSTLHTNDSASGITRLVDMGIEAYLVASSVEAFVAQRLVRVLCPECKSVQEDPLPGIREEIRESLNLDKDAPVNVYQANGCDHCSQTGYYGRMAIYEILMLNDAIRAAILEKPRSDYIKRIAMREGLQTLRQSGWGAVLNGLTTPDEVIHVTVKDEYLEEKTGSLNETKGSAHDSVSIIEDFRLKKSMKAGEDPKSAYRERIYPRTCAPVDLAYKIVKRSKDNPDTLETVGEEVAAKTENISAGGLLFRSAKPITVGTILDLRLYMEDRKDSIECLGKVCRLAQNGSKDGKYKIATYYLDITSADRVTINRYILEKLKNDTQGKA